MQLPSAPLPGPRDARVTVVSNGRGLGEQIHTSLAGAGVTAILLASPTNSAAWVRHCDVVFLAIDAAELEALAGELGPELTGKVLVVCSAFVEHDESGFFMEPGPEGSVFGTVVKLFPDSRVVGALQQFGPDHLELARLGLVQSDAPIVGDDREATDLVEALVDLIQGLEAVWVGKSNVAAVIEGLAAIVNEVSRQRNKPVGFRIQEGGGLRFL